MIPPKCSQRLRAFVLLVMMLAPMLCYVGCASKRPLPASVHQGATGNAILTSLQPGTVLQFPTPEQAANFRGLFFNETKQATTLNIVIVSPLKVCTPAYIADRDASEATLFGTIQTLKIENQSLRLK